MLLEALHDSNVFTQCLILVTVREMCGYAHQIQDDFRRHDGFFLIFSLLAQISRDGLGKQTLVVPHSRRASFSEKGSEKFPSEPQRQNSADVLLLVRQVMLTIIAGFAAHPVNRHAWTRYIGFERLVTLLISNYIVRSRRDVNCVCLWMLWMALEFLPDDPKIPSSEAAKSKRTNIDFGEAHPLPWFIDDSFLDAETQSLGPLIPPWLKSNFAQPHFASHLHVPNPLCIVAAVRLLPHATTLFQLKVLNYLADLARCEHQNLMAFANIGLVGQLCVAFRQSLLEPLKNVEIEKAAFDLIRLLLPHTTNLSDLNSFFSLVNTKEWENALIFVAKSIFSDFRSTVATSWADFDLRVRCGSLMASFSDFTFVNCRCPCLVCHAKTLDSSLGVFCPSR